MGINFNAQAMKFIIFKIFFKIFLKNLHIFLSEHSMDYLLDTLMKIQFMCRSYHHILDPIMT